VAVEDDPSATPPEIVNFLSGLPVFEMEGFTHLGKNSDFDAK
jgi:hypothetical protein